MSEQHKAVMMKPVDTVAVALQALEKGTSLIITSQQEQFHVTLKHDIEFGHKFAVKQMKPGDDVMKYGEVIGSAQRAIAVGEHVHVHNVEGKRGRGDKIAGA
ncbi:UxaA family hydrolase [Alteribacillus sp. HJP-4]|uniref:UxaA family hydrolase n=1 Tax=Alteribacillus sp. HJP-4 TaxID=2775394 RepID=UPI0035CCEAF2